MFVQYRVSKYGRTKSLFLLATYWKGDFCATMSSNKSCLIAINRHHHHLVLLRIQISTRINHLWIFFPQNATRYNLTHFLYDFSDKSVSSFLTHVMTRVCHTVDFVRQLLLCRVQVHNKYDSTTRLTCCSFSPFDGPS